MTNISPIVLFVYNRPSHTKVTLDALSKNVLAKSSDLIIYSDAPRDKACEKSVLDVRNIIGEINGFKSVKVIERKENYGLAKNIIEGVTEITRKYGRVIVLEDDIVTSPYFLKFMNMALDAFSDEKKIWHVSGWNYPINTEGMPDVFLWRVMNCWGWATWDDRWKHFKKEPSKLIKSWSRAKVNSFNLDGCHNFWDQVKNNENKKINTWAIFWYAAIFENTGLCLQPSESLVHNSGHDGTGQNCKDVNAFDTSVSKKCDWDFGVSINESIHAIELIKKFYRNKNGSFLKKMKLRLKNLQQRLNPLSILKQS